MDDGRKLRPIQETGGLGAALRYIQGNFERIQLWYDDIVQRHNSLVDDVAELKAFIEAGIEPVGHVEGDTEPDTDGGSP